MTDLYEYIWSFVSLNILLFLITQLHRLKINNCTKDIQKLYNKIDLVLHNAEVITDCYAYLTAANHMKEETPENRKRGEIRNIYRASEEQVCIDLNSHKLMMVITPFSILIAITTFSLCFCV